MNITFKNLEINFSKISAEMTGDAYLTISEDIANRFFEDTEGCEYGTDAIDQYNEDEDGEGDFTTTNADHQIVFFNWAMEQDETISFNYEGDNVFWLYHDFNHAMYDVTGTEIYVNGSVEAERCYQAINMLKERNELHFINEEMLRKMYTEFEQRGEGQSSFKGAFDLEKALELAEIEKEIYIMCYECDTEEEPEELEDDQYKCTECEHEGEKEEFYHELEFELY
jgi:hypothetical protein